MINKIKLIKNIGNFEQNTEIVFESEKMNIFYGLNATGKTTLTRLIKLNSELIVSEEKNKLNQLIKTYGEDTNIEYEIDLEGERNIKVFDNEYISEKIGKKSFDLNKFEVENAIDENLKNPLEDEYLKYRNKIEELEAEGKNIKENLNNSLVNEFNLLKSDIYADIIL